MVMTRSMIIAERAADVRTCWLEGLCFQTDPTLEIHFWHRCHGLMNQFEATVLATLADPPCDFLLPGETLSVRSNDKESNRKVSKRTILKQWQTGKFVRGKQDYGIRYEITPTYLVYYQDEKQVLSLKALIAKTQGTCVHGFKPFPEGSVTSKLVASAEEPLYLTKFDEEIHQVQKAMASVPYMKMLWCFSFDAATKKLNPAVLALS